MSPSTVVSSERLEKILEVNSKAIEINTIVNAQYDRIIKQLESTGASDRLKEKDVNSLFKNLEEGHDKLLETNKELKKNSEDLLTCMKDIKAVVEKIDRTLFRVTVVLLSSSAIFTALAHVITQVILKV